MATTTKFGLELLDANDVLKYVKINKNSRILDSVTQINVINQTTTTPPGSPNESDGYVIPAGATGPWAGRTDELAFWLDGQWVYIVPFKGLEVFDKALDQYFLFISSWTLSRLKRRRTIEFHPQQFIQESGALEETTVVGSFSKRNWRFRDGNDDSISVGFSLPKHGDYSDVNIRLHSFEEATGSGDLRWNITIYNSQDGGDLNSATSVIQSFTQVEGTTVADELMIGESGEFDLNNLVTELSDLTMVIERESTHASDDFDADCRLTLVKLQYKEKWPP